ncbi:FAD binding domain-containing protein [Halorientalis persicus]|uniref:FAD binding domain-containing protein n=1 Tax=Halorientalis persicus TaxID=1367881 RepID=A0A1H8QB50_9EURY|nr:NAD(P)/FAD-dependent oxidoreductase [Halorientalis persicus]SEO51147.1 FAD binding domain-containing protein [Halorientalis persicus]
MTESYDIAIVGGGPAGCSAGVFCSRAGLDTVVVTNDRSTLRKSAFVENYLGFPLGIEPRALLELVETHAREAGCSLVNGTVKSAETDGNGIVLHLGERSILAERILAASWSDSTYLNELGVRTETESSGSVSVVQTDERGETNVDDVYAAGRLTDTHHQAIVNAGDGARVALEIIEELDTEFYNDWIALEGYYESYDREVPVGVKEIDHDERRNRIERATDFMSSFFETDRSE